MRGIRVDGENHFLIAPKPGGRFTFARGVYRSIYGNVECGWKKGENGLEYQITIPTNCTAEVILPDGTRQILSAGTHLTPA